MYVMAITDIKKTKISADLLNFSGSGKFCASSPAFGKILTKQLIVEMHIGQFA